MDSSEKLVLHTNVTESGGLYERARASMHAVQHSTLLGEEFFRNMQLYSELSDKAAAYAPDVSPELREEHTEQMLQVERLIERELEQTFQSLAKTACGVETLEPERVNEVLQQLRDFLNVPSEQAALEGAFGADLQKLSIEGFRRAVFAGTLSHDTMANLLMARAVHIEKLQGPAHEALLRTEQALASVIAAKVAGGALPTSAQAALHRFEHRQVFVMDVLTDLYQGTHGAHLIFDSVMVRTDLLAPEKERQLEAVQVHELLHVLSGRSTDVQTHACMSDETSPVLGRKRKSGLTMVPRTLGGHARFRWLTEAVTEWLNGELLPEVRALTGSEGPAPLSIYVPEIKDLHDLFEKGLSRELLLNAYFENIEQGKEKQGVHFAALMQSMQELCGPRALSALENKYTLKEIGEELSQLFVYSAEVRDHFVNKGKSVCFKVSVRVGTADEDRIVQDYFFMPVASVAQEEARVRSYLAALAEKYGGKVRYTIEPQASSE